MIILFKGDMFTPSKLISLEKLASQKKSSLADFSAFNHHFLRAMLNYMHGLYDYSKFCVWSTCSQRKELGRYTLRSK